ncbi:MAG: hypothetical protein ACON4N_08380, partial [Myxococcota bacterium]
YVPTSGSVTVHSIGQEPGDLVDVSYDLTFNGESNGWDTGGARQDGSVSISISGTLSDTISTRIEDVDFPLKDKEALCDLVNCATSGPLLMVGIDEYCEDIPSLDAVHVMGAQMASRLRAVASHFRAAGEGSLAYVLPTESLYLTDADVLFGEADALALAASIEAAAFVFEFMDQYDILDSDKAFDDYTTSNDWYRWDGNSCEVVPGVIDDRRALHDDLGAYAASPRTGFSLSEAQASLDHVFTDLIEMLAASPTHGVLRPQGGANRDVREAYAGDLTALRTSLATPGATAIPSTSGFINATLNDFFTTPPTRDAILKSYTNGNPVIASIDVDLASCENDFLTVDTGIIDFALDGAGGVEFSGDPTDHEWVEDDVPFLSSLEELEATFDDKAEEFSWLRYETLEAMWFLGLGDE